MSAAGEPPRPASSRGWKIASMTWLLVFAIMVIGGWEIHRGEINRMKKTHAKEMNVACTRLLIECQGCGLKQPSLKIVEPFLPYARRKQMPDGTVRHYWQETWTGGGCSAWITIGESGIVDGNHECQEI